LTAVRMALRGVTVTGLGVIMSATTGMADPPLVQTLIQHADTL
jgi:hypothetical protein